jgi:hypothetical protein
VKLYLASNDKEDCTLPFGELASQARRHRGGPSELSTSISRFLAVWRARPLPRDEAAGPDR